MITVLSVTSGRCSGEIRTVFGMTDRRTRAHTHTCVSSSGPPGVTLSGADQQVATATGLREGRYAFRLTVCDQEGATDSASLTVQVQEGHRNGRGHIYRHKQYVFTTKPRPH